MIGATNPKKASAPIPSLLLPPPGPRWEAAHAAEVWYLQKRERGEGA